MGSIVTNIDVSLQLTINTVKGHLLIAELLNWVSDYYSGTVTRFILWDLTEANLSKISTEEFRNIVQEVKKKSETRTSGKTAFVVKRDFEFGIGRMIETFGEIEKVNFENRSFRSMADAKKWLGV